MPPIVLACDQNYAMPLATTLRSLVDSNRRHWPLDITVLSDGFTGLFEPLAHGCFGNGFAQSRDFDFGGHELVQPFFWRRISSRTL